MCTKVAFFITKNIHQKWNCFSKYSPVNALELVFKVSVVYLGDENRYPRNLSFICGIKKVIDCRISRNGG